MENEIPKWCSNRSSLWRIRNDNANPLGPFLTMTPYGSISFSSWPKCPYLIPHTNIFIILFILFFSSILFPFYFSWLRLHLPSSLCTFHCGPFFVLDHHILKIKSISSWDKFLFFFSFFFNNRLGGTNVHR